MVPFCNLSPVRQKEELMSSPPTWAMKQGLVSKEGKRSKIKVVF